MLNTIDSYVASIYGVERDQVQHMGREHFAIQNRLRTLVLAIGVTVHLAKSRMERVRPDGQKTFTDASYMYLGPREFREVDERFMGGAIECTGEFVFRYRTFIVHACRVDEQWRLFCPREGLYALTWWGNRYVRIDHIVKLATFDESQFVMARIVDRTHAIANIDGEMVKLTFQLYQVDENDEDASVKRYDCIFKTEDSTREFRMVTLITVVRHLRKLQRSWRRFLAMKAAGARIWAIWSRIRCNPHTHIGRKLFEQDMARIAEVPMARIEC
jgi:hypothetical protein